MICPVCQLRPIASGYLCRACGRSYDKTLGGDILSVIIWAAERARYFDRRRRARHLRHLDRRRQR